MIGVTIRFDDVSRVRGRREILEGVGPEARPGWVTGSAGPNGTGESSSLRILLGLGRIVTGHTTLNGRSYREPRNLLKHVDSMLDRATAHPSRTTHAHLGWVATSNGIPRKGIQQVLEEAGLTADANRRIGTCSLDMGQRLGLATVLLGKPERLVPNGPVNGLDSQGVRQVRRLLRAYADAGGTALLSSHLIGELAKIVDDVMIISDDRVKVWGGVADVTTGHSSLKGVFFTYVGAWA